jgi:hypothetical protein
MSSMLYKYTKGNRVLEIHHDPDAEDPAIQFDNWSPAEHLAWANGFVYGFVVYDPSTCSECGAEKRTNEDSCWGFYGTDCEKNGLYEAAGAAGLVGWELCWSA